ncbi:MAG: MBOAT family protein, partial [Anaerolineales bacterium]|nr:MBOAT family protein [Anaerolineales bacterium]
AFDAAAPGFGMAWLGTFAYGFQIYFDFSGYSDMAVGLALLFGFVLPRNFDAPYRSASITEFWRRWHISLSTFLRDNLYIPLGGNRHGGLRTAFNLAAVMLLGGLWHGAAWNFVVWGGWHGVWLGIERGWRGRAPWWPRWARVARTFVLVHIGWVFFRADDLGRALDHLGAMAGLGAADGAAVAAAW